MTADQASRASARRRGAPWWRRLLGPLVIAALGVAGYFGYSSWSSEDEGVHYVTAEVSRGDLASVVTATGTLKPVIQVDVGSLVSGRIKELFADYNSEVKKGQVLAIIDPQLFQTAVAQARARLSSARADLTRAKAVEANAKVQLERLQRLTRAGAVADSEVDRANADWLAAKAQVEAAAAAITQARAALDQAAVNLEYTTVQSPIDGIVVSRNVDVGQSVAASLQAPTLFVIAEDLRKMEVHTSVAESDVGQLHPGTKAEFTVDAFPGETFAGTVKQVRYEAVNISNVVTYDAIISVDNSSLKLRPGMTANVNFVLAERHGVLLLANRALRYRPSDPSLSADAEDEQKPGETQPRGRPARGAANGKRPPLGDKAEPGNGKRRPVWVLEDGKPTRAFVVLGLSDGTSSEIASGDLTEGDLVIVSEGDEPAEGNNQRRRGPPRVL